MARKCEICGRAPEHGSKVSHSGRHTQRVRLPNLQRVHARFGGRRGRIRVCARCLKAGKVTKA